MTLDAREWMILVYKIPSHPTRLRAHIWRRLVRCGALYLQNSVCLLPATPEAGENLRWLADEIEEMGGEAHVFRAHTAGPRGDAALLSRFRDVAAREREKVAAGLQALMRRLRGRLDLTALEEAEAEFRRLRLALLRCDQRDHFPGRDRAAPERLLRQVRGALETQYARVAGWGRRR
jgi:DNA-binding transcriptional regulator PaaX